MGEFVLKLSDNGIWYGVFSHFQKHQLKHGISTRLGGVSKAPYNCLNLGLGTEDEREAVWANRRLFCQALGLNAENAVTTRQVHGDKVYAVTQNDVGIKDGFHHTVMRDTDALITNIPGIPLMLVFADCVPIIVHDPVRRAVGVCHAGWRGTMANIAAKMLSAMQEEYKTEPSDCLAAVGPSIGSCCYEVDEVVIDNLERSFSNEIQPQVITALAEPKDGKWRLNLWETNKVKLREKGIPAGNIVVSSVCTSCNTALYFSHRAENGITGRIGAIVCL